MSLGVVREHAEWLFEFSPYTHRFFPRILCLRVKKSEHPESVQKCLKTLLLKIFEKSYSGYIYMDIYIKINFLFLFFASFNINAQSLYGEYAKWRYKP
jgi:hypothetical protein